MCVKIFKNQNEYKYDSNKSFDSQIEGSTQIVVSYEPNDKNIEHFLKEVQNCVLSGINPQLNIKVEYNNFLSGFKMKKTISKTLGDICLNEVIKMIVISQNEMDKKLEELANMCNHRDIDVK